MLRGRVFYVYAIDRFSCICVTTSKLFGLDVIVHGLRLLLAETCCSGWLAASSVGRGIV